MMKVITQPRTFITGGPLAPEELNAAYLYARDAVADVAQLRWARLMVPYQWVTDVGTPYTQASGILLEHRFICPLTCVVESASFNGNLTCAAQLRVDIVKVGGSTPDGCSVPWLATDADVTDPNETTTDVSLDRFQLDAGSEYKMTITCVGAAAFTLNRFDLLLNVAVDRWTVAGTSVIPDFNPSLFTDAIARDANIVLANNTALATQAALFASAKTAVVPVSFQVHGFTSATDLDILRFLVPRFSSLRAQCVVKRLFVFASMAGVGGGTVKAILKTQANVVQATATSTVAGVTQATGDSGAVSVAMAGAFSPAVAADDLKLVFENSSAGTNCLRAHALMWLARV